jgi:hypothetical protein
MKNNSAYNKLSKTLVALLIFAVFAWITIFLPYELPVFFHINMGEDAIYFVRRDIFEGICDLLGILVVSPFLVYEWQKSSKNFLPLFLFCSAIAVHGIARMSLALLQTENIFGNGPIVPWPSASEYIGSKMYLAYTMPATALILYLAILYLRKQKRSNKVSNG